MIDNKTHQRLLVHYDPLTGYFVRISNANDYYGFNELIDNYFLPYAYSYPIDLKEVGGCEYHFGMAIDIVKLQAIIDEIDVPSDYLVSTEIIHCDLGAANEENNNE